MKNILLKNILLFYKQRFHIAKFIFCSFNNQSGIFFFLIILKEI